MAGALTRMLGLNPAAAVSVTPTAWVTGVDVDAQSTNTFNYTATGLTNGKPLIVMVCGMSSLTASSRSISSLTADSGSVTLISSHTSAVTARPYGIYVVTGFSGTSVLLTLTFNSTMQACVMGHFQLNDTTQTTYSQRTGAAPTSTGTATTSTTTPNITIPAGGIGFGIFVSLNSTLTPTLTADVGSVTSGLDITVEASGSTANSARFVWAYSVNASAQNFICTTGTTSSKWAAAFSWAP